MISLHYTAMAISWLPLALASLIGVVSVAAARILAATGAPASLVALQFSAILLSTAAGFVFDDPASDVLAASPMSLAWRRMSRMLVIIPVATSIWAVLIVWHGPFEPESAFTLTCMYLGLLGLSLGIAGVTTRRGGGGAVVAPIVFITIVVSSLLPPRWRPMPLGDVPGGLTSLQLRWSATGLAGLLLLVASSRDPGSVAFRMFSAGGLGEPKVVTPPRTG